MGGGSYSYMSAHSRSASYAHQSREEVFSQRDMDGSMNISDKVRECCDTDEHPETFPIIIAMDVTGSMGHVPEELIKGIFPNVMKHIAEAGVQHAQVCFVGFGDHYTDRAPLQVGQFESSDELMDKWLKTIWLEGGGGGNGGESTLLAYYLASRHTKCDHIIKRHGKGVLITISDEKTHLSLDRNRVNRIFGDSLETENITVSEMLNELADKWDVYHFCLNDWSCQRQGAQMQWGQLLPKSAYSFDDDSDLQTAIPAAIVMSYKAQYEERVVHDIDARSEQLKRSESPSLPHITL